MYIDSVVLSGLAAVVALVAMLGYVGYYGYRHMRVDMERARVNEGPRK